MGAKAAIVPVYAAEIAPVSVVMGERVDLSRRLYVVFSRLG